MKTRRMLLCLLLLTMAVALEPPFSASGAPRHKKSHETDAASIPDQAPFDRVLEKTVARERMLVELLHHYNPRIETYVQNLDLDPELGNAPISDHYFLGRLEMDAHLRERNMLPPPAHRVLAEVMERFKGLYSVRFQPKAFAALVLDPDDFDTRHYQFEFVRGEFLGEVRCLVIDVKPRRGIDRGWFEGRIWVEDHNYNIVRFNGTCSPDITYSFHFDSWRQNLQPGVWLPSYIYSEESDLKYIAGRPVRFKAATRLWGYGVKVPDFDEELTRVVVDAPQPVRDSSETANDASPVVSQRQWLAEAESNVLDRLQKAALLAPPSAVDKVLETVVNNLIATNNLDDLPPIHCRVLLTTPLESTTVGNTIVLSRGLLDVLPDEASLAMVLAHELSHIVLGHTIDTRYAFNDRLLVSNEQLLRELDLHHTIRDEFAADYKAVDLLKNSPYKEKLANAGLFLRAALYEAQRTPSLFTPRVGDALIDLRQTRPLVELVNGAPKLHRERLDQIAALPLGARIKVNPWNGEVDLINRKPVTLHWAREKMAFEVTPLFPFLTRLNPLNTDLGKQALIAPKTEP